MRHILLFSVTMLAIPGCAGHPRAGDSGMIVSRDDGERVLGWPEDRGAGSEPVWLAIGTSARIIADLGTPNRHGRFRVEILDGPYRGRRLDVAEGDFSYLPSRS